MWVKAASSDVLPHCDFEGYDALGTSLQTQEEKTDRSIQGCKMPNWALSWEVASSFGNCWTTYGEQFFSWHTTFQSGGSHSVDTLLSPYFPSAHCQG
jgi:hypothetical protein